MNETAKNLCQNGYLCHPDIIDLSIKYHHMIKIYWFHHQSQPFINQQWHQKYFEIWRLDEIVIVMQTTFAKEKREGE
jgi:hypothetical protein